MCKSNAAFGKWAESRGISVDRDEANPDIHPLVRRYGQTFKPPPEFFYELRTALDKAKSDDKPFILKMLTHFDEKPAALNGDSETDTFRPSMSTLVQALKRSRRPNLNERTLRKTGDALLAELVDHLDDSFVATRIFGVSEFFVRLPYRDERYQVKKARFDEALLVELKDKGSKDAIIRELLNSEFQYKMEAFFYHQCPETYPLAVFLFNVEYKTSEETMDIKISSVPGIKAGGDASTAVTKTITNRDWAINEMCLHLAVTLFQCKALGFDDMPAFGATIVGNDFRLYVAEWDLLGGEDGNLCPSPGIKIRFQKRYSLDDGVQICDLCVLLSRLFKHLIDEFIVQYSRLKMLDELKANLEKFRWRVPDSAASTTRTAASSSSSVSQKAAREDEDEDAPSKLTKKYLRSVGSVERSSSERVASWADKCLEEELLEPVEEREATDRRTKLSSSSSSDNEDLD
ncbi:hypothetical protein SCHPADRAFT_903745 [Schizopora paradoxa]|uniref:Uncharacterized protein n=1 Tax=Schizopora paradoxa TaxID=27342 RepID=A0A0H2RPQ1_9AGAM|nr:hypothetical protein SCHPADRAFT_903745 [Schizopora paradoxa]